MTGNFEQPKHTGASAARPEASCVSLRSQGLAQPGTSLVQADDILTPEELAAILKVPDSWVYERPAGAAETRFHACGSGATCDSIGWPWQHG